MAKIQLGDRVKDNITGLVGIAVTISDHLFGCRHICVQPESLDKAKDKPKEPFFLDEARCSLVKSGAVKGWSGSGDSTSGPGGPSLVGHPPR